MDSVQSLIEEPPGESEHQPHVAGVVEALPGHALDALLRHQTLDELEIGVELRESLHVDLDHHVHGAAGHDGDQAGGVPQLGEG